MEPSAAGGRCALAVESFSPGEVWKPTVENFRASNDHCLLSGESCGMSIFLRLSDWNVASVVEKGDGIFVDATYLPEPVRCPRCSGEPLYKHGKNLTSVQDTPIGDRPVTLRINRQRYRCSGCKMTSLQALPDIDPNHRITTECITYITTQSAKRAFSDVAESAGVDEKTVRKIGRQFVGLIEPFPIVAPLILGIDEVMMAGKLRGVFTDLAEHSILDVTESRSEDSVVKWLKALRNRKRVFVVCMDMWLVYRVAVRKVFGKKAHVVVDKFHVFRLANHCMHMAQKQDDVQVASKAGPQKKRRLKRLLLKRKTNLDNEERLRLSKQLRGAAQLRAAYRAKEEFLEIYKVKSRSAAEKALAKWKNGLSQELQLIFGPLLRGLKIWRHEILSYWDHGEVTNAFTESMNKQIKKIAAVGGHYSFTEVRSRVLVGYVPKPPKDFYVCERCGSDSGIVQAEYSMPFEERVPGSKRMRLCDDCHRKLLDRWVRRKSTNDHPRCVARAE
jgi:transposase